MSTRWNGHARRRTIGEGTLALDVRTVRKLFGAPKPDSDLAGEPRECVLHWKASDGQSSGGITLEEVPAPFGGVRRWLRCPECGQRRRALYTRTTTTGASVRWRCRECMGLAYPSQRLTPLPTRRPGSGMSIGVPDAAPRPWLQEPGGEVTGLSVTTTERVYATVAALCDLHTELGEARLTWEALRRVLAREGVLVASVPLGRPAKLLPYEGRAVMLLDNSRKARHLWYAAHEFGHWKLHASEDPYERCFHMDDVLGDDPMEHEADLFADLLMYGPQSTE